MDGASFGSNSNPSVYSSTVPRRTYDVPVDETDACEACARASATPLRQGIDALEVFELIRHLNDPEHPLTLEQLNVASLDLITVDDENSVLDVRFTPTIPHCSMATLIGLCIRVKLIRSLPPRLKVYFC